VDTIGQQVKTGDILCVSSLARMGKGSGWRHPEWYKIEQWMRGERQNFRIVGRVFGEGLGPTSMGKLVHPMDMEDLGMHYYFTQHCTQWTHFFSH